MTHSSMAQSLPKNLGLPDFFKPCQRSVDDHLQSVLAGFKVTGAACTVHFRLKHCSQAGKISVIRRVQECNSILFYLLDIMLFRLAIGNNVVRVINRQDSSDRALLKGFGGVVTDIAFSHSTSNTLAATDDAGNIFVWNLFQTAGKIKLVIVKIFAALQYHFFILYWLLLFPRALNQACATFFAGGPISDFLKLSLASQNF